MIFLKESKSNIKIFSEFFSVMNDNMEESANKRSTTQLADFKI